MRKDAKELWKIADDCYRAGRYTEAIDLFKEYIWANPNDPAGHHGLGMAYGGSGQFAEAIDPFHRALRLNPTFAEVYYRLGTIYGELEQHDEAASAYQSAIRLDPDNVTCHCALAELFLEQNKPADAVVPAKEAVRLNPDLADAYLLLGCALHSDSATFAEAAAAYAKSLQLKPDQFVALANLGDIYLGMGKLEEAQEVLVKARLINPNDPKLRALLGETYRRANKREDALVELEILKRLDSSRAEQLSKSLNLSPD
jgi:protein O-GlcNAc transferase